ncbi:hypothetical protein BGX34_004945, partial [Mortierella sp. NVP85]
YVNDLSMTINLEETLQDAEILYRRLEHLVEKVDAQRQGQEGESSSSSSTTAATGTSSTATTPEIPAILRSLLKNRSCSNQLKTN